MTLTTLYILILNSISWPHEHAFSWVYFLHSAPVSCLHFVFLQWQIPSANLFKSNLQVTANVLCHQTLPKSNSHGLASGFPSPYWHRSSSGSLRFPLLAPTAGALWGYYYWLLGAGDKKAEETQSAWCAVGPTEVFIGYLSRWFRKRNRSST